MIRALIILPIYFLLMDLLPRLPMYDRFAALVESTEAYMGVHFAGYIIGIIAAIVLWLIVERWTENYFFSPFFRVLRLGLIGVLVTCVYQLYCFANGYPLSVLMLMVAPIFMVAEIVYEIIEGSIVAGRLARWKRGAA